MITCNDISNYLNSNYPHKDSIANLSRNSKIKDKQIVFSFDAIKSDIYHDNCASADILWVKNNLNLIEFKTGFASPDETASDKLLKENMLLKIRIKAYESLHLLQTAIIDEISPPDILSDEIKITFCAVIDSNEPVVAEDVISDILLDAGNVRENNSLKFRVIDNALSMYRKQTDKRKKLFYDETFVLYDYEFDSNISKFK